MNICRRFSGASVRDTKFALYDSAPVSFLPEPGRRLIRERCYLSYYLFIDTLDEGIFGHGAPRFLYFFIFACERARTGG